MVHYAEGLATAPPCWFQDPSQILARREPSPRGDTLAAEGSGVLPGNTPSTTKRREAMPGGAKSARMRKRFITRNDIEQFLVNRILTGLIKLQSKLFKEIADLSLGCLHSGQPACALACE